MQGGATEGAAARIQATQTARHENTLPLLVTGLALAAQDDYAAPRVVIGLPIADYRTQAREFEQATLGYYDAQLPHKRVRIELARGQVVAFPEGAGALWALLLGSKGQPLDTPPARRSRGGHIRERARAMAASRKEKKEISTQAGALFL